MFRHSSEDPINEAGRTLDLDLNRNGPRTLENSISLADGLGDEYKQSEFSFNYRFLSNNTDEAIAVLGRI